MKKVLSGEIEDLRLKLYLHLNFLIRELDVAKLESHFDLVFCILESLPLATVEYDLARRRLENAQRYVRSGEKGAARFELRLVLGWARSFLDQAALREQANHPRPVPPPPGSHAVIESTAFDEVRSS